VPSLDPARSLLAIGQLSERSGVSVSALRFYEQNGLIVAERTAGNQRRYRRDVLRRIAFIRTSQRVGISLAAIRAALDSLPGGRAPTRADWARLSASWKDDLDARIADLQHLRSELDGCIGCGCLSLTACALQNPDDVLGSGGEGPVRWGAGA
jgi:MerR family redox-sensitive transcriptional activator SoxR